MELENYAAYLHSLEEDVRTLIAERDALALEVSELKARERERERNSLAERVFFGQIDTESWNLFEFVKILTFLNNAWDYATQCDLPRGNGSESELVKIAVAMRKVIRHYLRV